MTSNSGGQHATDEAIQAAGFDGVLRRVILLGREASGATLNVPGAFSTIQAAIDTAKNGDTVRVADGTYQGVGNRDLNFKGKAITVRSANGPQACTIDCQLAGRGAVFYSGETAASVLSGFTIVNGRAEYGGGIACTSSSPTINNCIIKYNASIEETDGGGIAVSNGSPVIKNCTIVGNTSTARGGGLAIGYISAPTIVNCRIGANAATYDGGGIAIGYGASAPLTTTGISGNTAQHGGGGIYIGAASSITVTTSIIADNRSVSALGGGGFCAWNDSYGSIKDSAIIGNGVDEGGGWGGGGIYIANSGNPGWEIENCTIAGNVAAHGGGLFFSSSSVKVTNCSIVNNSAKLGKNAIYAEGGGLYLVDASGTITGCTISGNTAHWGGGIYLTKGFSSVAVSLVNCLIAKNRVYIDPYFEAYGGGIFADGVSPVLTNCTVSQNSADGGGGGICHGWSASPVVKNSIIWANTPGEISEYGSATTTLAVTHSNVKGGYPGTGNISRNPLFLDTSKSDYHLKTGSPCINKGSNAAVGLAATDKNGNPRILNGKVDMGAYEYTGSQTTPVVRVTVPDAAASEPPVADSGKVTFSRTGDLAAKMVLGFAATGTAVNGTDYRRLTAQATIPAGKSSANLLVKPLADGLSEGNETAVITILPGSAYEIGSPGLATVTIKDNGS